MKAKTTSLHHPKMTETVSDLLRTHGTCPRETTKSIPIRFMIF